VRRAGWLAVALVLVFPALAGCFRAVTSAAFVTEFVSDGRIPALSTLTAAPSRHPFPASDGTRTIRLDLHRVPGLARQPGLVLAHGLSPRGKDEPQLVAGARRLARAGFAVAVPTVEGLVTLRFRPEDKGAVRAAVDFLWQAGHRPVAILGISVGAGPALLAAAEPGTAERVSAVLALGGYADSVELLRYTLTGAYGFDGVTGRQTVNPIAIDLFVRANADLVAQAGRAIVDNRDPAAFDRLAAALPLETRRLLDELSPARVLPGLKAPLFLIHGRGDPAVPFTESLRLERAARAAGIPVRVVVASGVAHVEAGEVSALADLWRLAAAFHAFRATAGN
jgi:dipeptidyl aminopeptidase/acylaminoacyl peptidase